MFHLLLNSPLYSVFIFLYTTLVLHTASGVQRLLLPQDFLFILLGSLEAFTLPLLIFLLSKKKRIVGTLAFAFYIFYYSLLAFYHLRTKSLADFGMTFSNVDLLANSNSWYVIKDVYRTKDWIQVAIFALLPFVPYLIDVFKKSEEYSFFDTPKKKIIAAAIFLMGISPLVFNYYSINKLTQYGQSAIEYAFPHRLSFAPTEDEIKTNLKIAEGSPDSLENILPAGVEIKNVFIVFLESFNVNYVEKKSPEGKEYTPFFNQLIKEGIYFENFYANSMQTAKGQFATLCSQIPHSKLKEMVALKKMSAKCLPSYLQELGYKTVFMQALSDLNFDNTGNFWKTHGFQETLSMDEKFTTEDERKKYTWGWGIQDNILYEKAIDYRQKTKAPKMFMALATISHHMKFKGIPEHLKAIYPEAKDSAPIEKRFVNSLHVMDFFLRDFFAKLDKENLRSSSLVILLGDHSFPNGEHGNYSTENTFYNENFKTPLLIIGPKLVPKRLTHIVSQIDIAPTVLELLKGNVSAAGFQGKNLFSQKGHIAPLIQPYDGRYLSVIKNGKKFVYHIRTDKRFLFDLSQDPKEENNLYRPEDDKEYFPLLKKILASDISLERSHQQEEKKRSN